ncbi:MAG: sulfatase-like hydrolase/transferase, partial [Lentisphaeria bacterium]|nr:sulfatase-like hydrolase/transferase [Lentisphaeria bacterium]
MSAGLDIHVTRRALLKSGAAGVAACLARPCLAAAPQTRRPNILLVMTDQQGLDTLSALGCQDVATPNLDRLARRATSFLQSYSTNPLCSPARSSVFSGRPTLETGVVVNGRPIRNGIPNLGQWLGEQAGYECLYA